MLPDRLAALILIPQNNMIITGHVTGPDHIDTGLANPILKDLITKKEIVVQRIRLRKNKAFSRVVYTTYIARHVTGLVHTKIGLQTHSKLMDRTINEIAVQLTDLIRERNMIMGHEIRPEFLILEPLSQDKLQLITSQEIAVMSL